MVQLHNEKERLAAALAKYYHRQQTRKYTGEPYIVHPAEVVTLLKKAGINDEDVLCAAWLHDTLEDTTLPAFVIEQVFGKRVFEMVLELTHTMPQKGLNRATRKQMDLIRFKVALSDTHSIKLADMISNTDSIIERDPKFAKVYVPEMVALRSVLNRGNQVLKNRVDDILDRIR